MKTLFLVRHAKSSWDDDALRDIDRPLAARGMRDARKMSKRLAKRDTKVDLMLPSPAARALATARLFAKQLGYEQKKIHSDKRLYATGARQLFAIIREIDDKRRRVMLFGHNPELETLARQFSKGIVRMPTCAVAKFKFDATQWSAIAKHNLAGATLKTPKRKKQSKLN